MHRDDTGDPGEAGSRLPHEALLVFVMDRSLVPMVVLDDAGTIREANGAFASMLGSSRARLLGRPFEDLADGATLDLEAGGPLHLRAGAGPVVVADAALARGEGVRIVSLHPREKPIDRRRELSTLVAGIGHEINNPLTYVIANTELVRGELRDLASRSGGEGDTASFRELDAMLDDVEHGAHQIRRLVRDLRALANLHGAALIALDVSEVIAEALALAKDVASPVSVDAKETPRVRGNQGQLAQVIASLLIHAVHQLDAPPRAADITVTTRELRGGVAIEVTDRGRGIPETALRTIFEPFAEGSPSRAPSGVGLSIAREIASAHLGTLEAQSTVGRGSTFTLWLPPMPEAEVPRLAVESTSSSTRTPIEGRQPRPRRASDGSPRGERSAASGAPTARTRSGDALVRDSAPWRCDRCEHVGAQWTTRTWPARWNRFSPRATISRAPSRPAPARPSSRPSTSRPVARPRSRSYVG